ncbi:hypothetical protein KC19_9G181100, partial [Ceratodon purpureus]
GKSKLHSYKCFERVLPTRNFSYYFQLSNIQVLLQQQIKVHERRQFTLSSQMHRISLCKLPCSSRSKTRFETLCKSMLNSLILLLPERAGQKEVHLLPNPRTSLVKEVL